MEAFICGLALIAVSGLGFITYWQPIIARKILLYLIGINAALIILIFLYFQSRENAYFKAANSVSPTLAISMNIDSSTLKSIFKQSFLDSIDNQKSILERRNFNSQGQQELYAKLISNVGDLVRNDEKKSESIILYCIISLLIFIVLNWLSTIFEGIHKKE